MRVLVLTAPLRGYAHALVPLGWELRAAGHRVLVATAGDAVRVADAGLPVADIARTFDLRRARRRMALRNPLLARAERAGRGGPRALITLFGEVNDDLADGAVAVADEWRPDLVIHDGLAPVGALVAARRGVPAVLCDTALYDGHHLSFAATGHLSYACGRHGVTDLPPPAAVIRLAPRSLVGDRPGWRMRYVPYDDGGLAAEPAAGPEPEPAAEPAPAGQPGVRRPRVVVACSNPSGVDRSLLRRMLRVAPAMDAEVVLARPDPATANRPLPGNVRVAEWTPLHRLLAGAGALVHHGGTAAALTALIHGVPQLVVPDAGERRYNAGLLYRRGVGLVAERRTVTPALLRRLLSATPLAVAAAAVRTEMTSAPDPAEVTAALTRLTEG